MQKIMFNDKYCLTELTLLSSKTMTRRTVPQKIYDEWKTSVSPLTFEDYAIQNSRFKIGEIVAIAMSYKDILELMIEKKGGYGEEEAAFEEKYTKTKGWNNKMFVKAEEMLHYIQITGMRCERLQDIPEEECLKEGIMQYGDPFHEDRVEDFSYLGINEHFSTPKEAFASLIDHVSKKGTWKSNPYVIAYSFKVVKYQKPQMLIEEEFNKAIAREIDNEIFMGTWYLGHPVDSEEYKLMLEEKEAYAMMKEANPHIEAQRMEYINSMDDVTSEHFTGSEIRALKAYFEASEKYNEVRERYVRTFEEAKARGKNTFVSE